MIFLAPMTDRITRGGRIGAIYRILREVLKSANPKKRMAKAAKTFFSLLKGYGSSLVRQKARMESKRRKGLSFPSKY
jgi:hypothetical protein